MPDRPGFRLPFFFPRGDGPSYPGVGSLIEQLLERRAERQQAEESNPQVGVVELPPPSSNEPAPLPNPEGAYAEPPPPPPPVATPAPEPGADYIPTGHYGADPGPFGPEIDDYGDAPQLPPPVPGVGGWEGEDWVFRDRGGRELSRNRGAKRKADEVAPEWLAAPTPSFGSGVNPFSTHANILAGERTFGGPRVSPFPNDPISTPSPDIRVERRIDTRLERSDEYYRRQAERAMRDSAIRQAGRVIEGVAERVGVRGLGPIGAIIGAAIPAGELGSGEMIPGFDAPMPAPPDFPVPVIEQPAPLPLPEPPWTNLPPPAPSQPVPTPTSTASGPAGTSTPTPAPRPGPVATPTLRTVPWWRLISGAILGSSPTPTRGPLTWPSSTVGAPPPSPAPATNTTSSTATPTPIPTPSPTGNPLTGFNPQVASSAPPALRTRTRTRECRCDPERKKRKKPRECTARGQLVWASGPKKGKPAGSRCIAFVGGNSK